MSSDSGRAPVPWLLFAYFCSGVAGLGYEVLWARWLSLQFGVSNVGVLVAVFAFLLGLGLGSAWGVRLRVDLRGSLRLFAAVELGVAGYMLLLPLLAGWSEPVWAALAPRLSATAWYWLELGVAALVLTLPAFALGMAFSVLVRTWAERGADLGRLYGWNTLGGVVGGVAPLVLLPSLGWQGAMWALVAVGALAGGLGWWLARALPADAQGAVVSAAGGARPGRALLWYGLVGAAAIMLEIAWARLFGLLFLRTEYVMGVILATYLVGVGVGSLWARRLSSAWLARLPVLVATAALLSLASVRWLGGWVEGWTPESLFSAVAAQAAVLFVVMAPVTLALGVWLPLLAQALGSAAEAGPRLYAANSLGGALGALVAGLLLVPAWGTAATWVVAALGLFGAGWALAPRRRWLWAAVPLAALAWPLWAMPEPKVLLPRSFAASETLFAYEDAANITHVVAQPDGQRLLLSDLQRMDASTDPEAVAGQRNQVRLALMLHPEPRRVLLLGLGTGISASATLALEGLEVTAVELSRGAIEAAGRFFQKANLGVLERIRVVNDDARHYLLASTGRYDVVVGDLFHPDLVGRSALLSVQQFERVRRRLAPGGVFVQWLTLNQFDLESLQVVLRSFAQVFPEGRLFLDGFRLALVGGVAPLRPAHTLALHRQRLEGRRFAFLTGGEGTWTWLARYWGGVGGLPPGPVQDEWAPRIEYRLPRARFSGALDLRANVAWLLARRPSVEVAARELGIGEAEPFRRAWQATAWALQGFMAALMGDPESDRWLRQAYEANPADRWVANAYAQRLLESLDQARLRGMDEDRALARILQVRADYLPALRHRYRYLQRQGRLEEAWALRRQIEALSPYERLAASEDVQVPVVE